MWKRNAYLFRGMMAQALLMKHQEYATQQSSLYTKERMPRSVYSAHCYSPVRHSGLVPLLRVSNIPYL